ncbi:collagen-like protein [Streptomyces sp. sk226]|uniref:collagen-like protein n=1 Tax=Streptomyces sp. sk226 TaxID=2034268 RepID=UPI0015CF742F|nr:collagen-like protein [Streptomyces sp. sk226]
MDGKRREAAALFFGCLASLFLAFCWWQINDLGNELRSANEARDQLAAQVVRLGERPVAGPPGSRGKAGKDAVGPSGPPGPAGTPGSPGPVSTVPGPPGKAGQDGKDASPVPGPSGPPGKDGATVTGPPGPAVTGPPGKDGTDGQNGKDGRDGVDGRDGQTCPAGYSLRPPPDDPDALVCRKDGAPAVPPPSPEANALDPTRRQYP